MHIVVGTRSTPDTAARLEITPNGRVDRGDAPLVINPWDEYAVEEALLRAGASGGAVTVLALGPEEHQEALKYALAMGADRAIRLWDDAWTGLDSRGYAAAFAAAVRHLGDVDLVIFGKEAADEASDTHIFQTARALGWTLFSAVARIVALESGRIRVEQLLEEGRQLAAGPLPAVISVLRGINEPRYPSFIGIRKAARAEVPVWDGAALGLSMPAPAIQVTGLRLPPTREGSCEIIGGDTVEAQAATLVEKLLAEKVI